MTTKRKDSKATERNGINYVRTIVEAHNCIFHEIDLGNDIGNDAHVEFIVGEQATGCCLAVQIKSGQSYVSADGSQLTLRADRDHFEYWRSHTLPIGAIIYDPQRQRATWIDVTAYLEANAERVDQGPYSIAIDASSEFSSQGFAAFRDHFMAYRSRYQQETNFGLALEKFSQLDDVEGCLDGIRALFSFHRQRVASWYYLISCFRNFRDHDLLGIVIHALRHIPGHGDIWWHEGNKIDPSIRKSAADLITKQFGREEVLILLEAVDEEEFQRGTIGQSVHAIIGIVDDRDALLRSIAFDHTVAGLTRCAALWLLVYYTQGKDPFGAIEYLQRFRQLFPDADCSSVIPEMIAIIVEFGAVGFY